MSGRAESFISRNRSIGMGQPEQPLHRQRRRPAGSAILYQMRRTTASVDCACRGGSSPRLRETLWRQPPSAGPGLRPTLVALLPHLGHWPSRLERASSEFPSKPSASGNHDLSSAKEPG